MAAHADRREVPAPGWGTKPARPAHRRRHPRRHAGRGSRALLDPFGQAGSGTFYLSMGPDRSAGGAQRPAAGLSRQDAPHRGRQPRTGWRTVLSGTLLPARPIATAFPEVARRVAAEGHEAGVHAWDHRRWQDRPAPCAGPGRRQLDRARQAFAEIFAGAAAHLRGAGLVRRRALLHQEGFGSPSPATAGGRAVSAGGRGAALATPAGADHPADPRRGAR